MNPIALYIHWPFCKKKCPYCDFNSHVREEVEMTRWQKALLAELEWVETQLAAGPQLTLASIFFGGGTPSLMPPDIAAELISASKRLNNITSNDQVEVTLEANPTSVEAKKFREFQLAGVNRVSLGVQSITDAYLQFLGREHSASEALDAVELAASLFDRYSFDMIYALPEQSLKDWEKELRLALPYTSDHMSLYQLTIEPGTVFHHAYHVKQGFVLPADGNAAQMYALTGHIMADAGMPAYEISNYAASGHQCRHNLAYWRGEAYIGIGPGAHGRLQDTNGNWIATAGIKSPERWLDAVETQGHGLEIYEPIPTANRLEEQLMMGLRLSEGIPLHSASPLHTILHHDQLDWLQNQQLLQWDGTFLHATDKGKLVLNSIIEKLIV